MIRSGPEMWEPAPYGTPYSTAARWPMFKIRKYVGQSTVEAPLWRRRPNPLTGAGGLAMTPTGAGTVSQILFIASTQIFRAKVCMRGRYDIDASSAEPEATHYRGPPPMAFRTAGIAPARSAVRLTGHSRVRGVPVMFLYAWFGWSAI